MTRSAPHRRNDNNATRKEGVTRGPIHVGNASKRSIQDAVIANVLLELKQYEGPTGRLKYGTFTPVFKKWKEECKWLRADMIHSRRKREKTPQAKSNDLDKTETGCSEIEDVSADQDVNRFVTEFGNQTNQTESVEDFHLDENEFDQYLSELNNLQLIGLEDNQPSKQNGRPIGSTDEDKRVQKERRVALIDDISVRYFNRENRTTKLSTIISTCKEEHDLPHEHVPLGTIRSRSSRGKLTAPHPGSKPPLHELEPTLVQLIKHCARFGVSIRQADIIRMAEEMMHNKPIGQTLVDFQLIHVNVIRKEYERTGIRPEPKLGYAWLNKFLKRYPEVKSSYGGNVKHYRHSWTNYSVMKDNYELTYQQWHEWGLVSKLDRPQWQDKEGNEVDEHDPACFGCPVEYQLDHPDWIFTFDETGDNTNQSDNKVNRAAKVVTARDGPRPAAPVSTADCHFTAFGATSLEGKVLCGGLYIKKGSKSADGKPQATQLNYNEEHGADYTAPWVGETTDAAIPLTAKQIADNTGPNKRWPGAISFEYFGKHIPSYVRGSSGGGVTAELLVGFLKHIDARNVFDRKKFNINPTLLVDGHDSRLHPLVICYINNLHEDGTVDPLADHMWNMSLGVPHATGYWQVGDATQQNGQFKHYSNKIKNRLCTRMLVNLKPYDIVPIYNYAFVRSFGDVDGTKIACAERGWNPLNMGALTHPDISATNIESEEEEDDTLDPFSQQSQLSGISQLIQRSAASHIEHKKLSRADLVVISQSTNVYKGFNLTGDITSQVFDKCQEQHSRLAGQRSALKKSRDEQHRIGLSQINIVGKISSGALNKEGVISPNHPGAILLLLLLVIL